jgi:hypothetical protein
MQSGDVKRGADLEVVLVQATPQFETEWKKAAAAYSKAGDDVKQQREETEAAQERAHQVYIGDILNASKEATYKAARAKSLEMARYVAEARDTQRQHALKLIQPESLT